MKLDIVGHSGDAIQVPFVQSTSPPANDKERLQVLKVHVHTCVTRFTTAIPYYALLWQAMIAESQYCMSGDHTVEATREAIQQITNETADDYFVIVFSDANFSRYGIKPRHFAALMNSDLRVNVFAIFIGSLGDEAKRSKFSINIGLGVCAYAF